MATGASRTVGQHAGFAFCVRYSPDGKTIASTSDDRTIRIWSPYPDLLSPSGSMLHCIWHTAWTTSL